MAKIAERTEEAIEVTIAVPAEGFPWSTVLKFALPAVVIATFLFLWNQVPTWAGLHEYELPTFSQDMHALVDQWGTIGPNLQATIVDALLGFFLGNVVGILGAI